MINKIFEPSQRLLKEAFGNDLYVVSGGAPFLDGRAVTIKNEHRYFKMSFTLTGDEVRKFHNIIPKTTIADLVLSNTTGFSWKVPSSGILLREFKDEKIWPLALYCVYHITKAQVDQMDDNHYWRLIMPLPVKNDFDFRDFVHYWFDTDIRHKEASLLKVMIQDKEFHFFYLRMDGGSFFGIDSVNKMRYKEFEEVVIAIQTSYAFLTGSYYLDEAFYISSSAPTFQENLGVRYTSMRESIISTYNIFTTNGSSVLAKLREEQGMDWNDEIDEWIRILLEFNPKVFDELTKLFLENDALSRAAFIILEANNLALELKAAAYCVAYEAICHTLKDKLPIETSTVIEKENWKENVKPFFEKGISDLLEKGIIDQEAHDILSKKINNLNQPTNKDALTAPFKHFNYSLKPYEEKAISDRNRFLHGSVPVKTNDMELASQKLYFTAITIHKLAYILILKLAGFEGYIINYAKLHESMTQQVLEEDGFVRI